MTGPRRRPRGCEESGGSAPSGSALRRSSSSDAVAASAVGGEAELHVGDDVGERPIVGLGPAVERVLVALGALDPDAQERVATRSASGSTGDEFAAGEPPPEQVEPRLGRRSRSVAAGLEGRCVCSASRRAQVRASSPVAARRAEHAAGDLVVRGVRGEPLAEPVVPEPGPARPQVVGPFHGVRRRSR